MTPMPDADVSSRIINSLDQILQTLTRIANAMDRAVPLPPDRTGLTPSDLKDLTVVTNALRKQWQKEDEQQRDLTRDLPSFQE